MSTTTTTTDIMNTVMNFEYGGREKILYFSVRMCASTLYSCVSNVSKDIQIVSIVVQKDALLAPSNFTTRNMSVIRFVNASKRVTHTHTHTIYIYIYMSVVVGVIGTCRQMDAREIYINIYIYVKKMRSLHI
jgi:hypothetical protein